MKKLHFALTYPVNKVSHDAIDSNAYFHDAGFTM
jgi:hypothetical protein